MKRAVLTAFGAAMTLFGVGHCSTPMCPCAYSNSFEEQDRKTDALCNSCLENLRRVTSRR